MAVSPGCRDNSPIDSVGAVVPSIPGRVMGCQCNAEEIDPEEFSQSGQCDECPVGSASVAEVAESSVAWEDSIYGSVLAANTRLARQRNQGRTYRCDRSRTTTTCDSPHGGQDRRERKTDRT